VRGGNLRFFVFMEVIMTTSIGTTSDANPVSTAFAPRFALGQLYYTPGAQEVLQRYQINPLELLKRHVSGDWGELCSEDAEANEEALTCGARLMSSYVLSSPSGDGDGDSDGDNAVDSNNRTLKPVKIWLITEADRSVTTLLLPDEY
jgi:hypothetical protein